MARTVAPCVTASLLRWCSIPFTRRRPKGKERLFVGTTNPPPGARLGVKVAAYTCITTIRVSLACDVRAYPILPRIFMCADVSDIPIMALVEEALPGAHCSPATARRLWQSHVQQQMRFVRSATRTAPTTAAQRKASNIAQAHSVVTGYTATIGWNVFDSDKKLLP